MSERLRGVHFLNPKQAKQLLESSAECRILDARDHWEQNIANLPRSEFLDETKLQELARAQNRSAPILIFCHFGVRSVDFAIKLREWDYQNVSVLSGGIDAWSQTVDPSVKRYEGSWC